MYKEFHRESKKSCFFPWGTSIMERNGFFIKEAVIFMSMLTEMGKQAKEAAVVLSVLQIGRAHV